MNKENVLLYCHSYYHSRDIIKKTLRKYKEYNYSYNDIKGKSKSKDIFIDLSKTVYDKDYLNKYYKKYYDIIWMVFCPCNVYIDETRKLRKSLFKNFKNLLDKNGIIITVLADNAKIDLLKNYIKNANERTLRLKNIEKLIRKIVEMLAFKLKLRLLSIEENKKYLIENENYSIKDYYILEPFK